MFRKNYGATTRVTSETLEKPYPRIPGNIGTGWKYRPMRKVSGEFIRGNTVETFWTHKGALKRYYSDIYLLLVQERDEAKIAGLEHREWSRRQKIETVQNELDAINRDIAIREQMSDAAIAEDKAITSQVDYYRSQVGLSGESADLILQRLYGSERAVAEEQLSEAMVEEQQEIDAQKTPTPWWAYVAGAGAVGGMAWFIKKRK